LDANRNQTLGTRGDVQPYIALALGLIARGHDVQIAAPEQHETLVTERGVPYAALPGEFLALIDGPEGKAALAGGEGFGAGFKLLKYVRPMMRRLLDQEWRAIEAFGADLIIYHPKSIAAPHIAEKLSLPSILASPLPGFTPTKAFPSPLLPFTSLGPLNRASHSLAVHGAKVLFGKLLREWRASSLGLTGSRGRAPIGTIYAYSPNVLPKPADWGPDVLVSGYWFLDSPTWQMPADLEAFLGAGTPPIYIGFGSMPGIDSDRLTAIAVEALDRSGNRGVLATGGGALAAVRTAHHVHFISGAPHDRLFPHMKATIHHGGAGTTGASLRAGKPMAICPFFGDQPFWARRVAALGAGPAPLSRKSLTVEALVLAMRAMTNPEMQSRTSALAAAIAKENGVDDAVDFIERLISERAL
jgi:UDP:flavonoid glycosyltransferase YjiC (YdhE family)